jgi:hypothetical protein
MFEKAFGVSPAKTTTQKPSGSGSGSRPEPASRTPDAPVDVAKVVATMTHTDASMRLNTIYQLVVRLDRTLSRAATPLDRETRTRVESNLRALAKQTEEVDGIAECLGSDRVTVDRRVKLGQAVRRVSEWLKRFEIDAAAVSKLDVLGCAKSDAEPPITQLARRIVSEYIEPSAPDHEATIAVVAGLIASGPRNEDGDLPVDLAYRWLEAHVG